MKVKTLRKILNDTTRPIADFGEYIAVGSPLCHNLISIQKDSLKISYALDSRGRKGINTGDLLEIWDILVTLIESGEIKEIIEGVDEAEDPIPVYKYLNGKIIEQECEVFGWPHSTLCGELMYDNTHFLRKEDAIKKGIEACDNMIEFLMRQIEELNLKIKEYKETIKEREAHLAMLAEIKD